jgi:sialate O-acetylesterase
MLKPVIPYTIKGAIWYQGESNVENYNEYQELFSAMIEDWREIWGYNFPFYYAQIAPAIYGESHLSHYLRDSQRKTLEFTSNTGMAILMDIGEKDNVHAKNKQDVGKRLALLALKNDYNFDIVPSGPLYKGHINYDNYIDIDFDYKGSGLCLKGNSKDFEIAGIDEVFYNASAKIIGDKLRVSSNSVIYPKHVRYGWKNWVVGSLFNKEGLPASSFNSLN